MKCWICKKDVAGKLIALTKHFETHTKHDLITKMVWLYYSQPRSVLLKADKEECNA